MAAKGHGGTVGDSPPCVALFAPGIHLEGKRQKAERRFFLLPPKGILKQHHAS